jgi:hypothetical protein
MEAMTTLGLCALCHEQRELRHSHFMPAALYPKNKKKKVLATPTRTFSTFDEITAQLFCEECEQRFNRNGENEVLRWLAPKAKKGTSPFLQALRQATPVWSDADLVCHWGSSLGISPEKFAYFGLSLVWRASVFAWPLPDGNTTRQLDLGEFSEPIRMFLLGKSPFPNHTFIMLTVCTDERSQEYWMPPGPSGELDGLVVAPIIGALFRFWFGRVLPSPIERTVFFPANGNPIFSTHCWDFLSVVMNRLFPT